MGVSLAWWHSFKWATKKIMQVFGKDLIAPMFHHLFPEREYAPEKMALPAMTTYLTQIRLAYPRFRQQLNTSLARNDITSRQRHVLANLSDLCEFFIPAVLLAACCDRCCLLIRANICVQSQNYYINKKSWYLLRPTQPTLCNFGTFFFVYIIILGSHENIGCCICSSFVLLVSHVT